MKSWLNKNVLRFYPILFIGLMALSDFAIIPSCDSRNVLTNIRGAPSLFFEGQTLSPSGIFFPDKAPWKPLSEPVLGPQSIIAILVDFNGTRHIRSRDDFNDLIFSKLNDYIVEVSYNKTWLVGNVTEWNMLEKDMEYYGKDSKQNRDANLYPLFKDSILLFDDNVDFSKYDHFIIIHAGVGQETSGRSEDIWSCYATYYPSINVDGIHLDKAIIVPEVEDLGLELFGVFAHEFLHSLGLPDLYNDYNSEICYAGRWGIMDKGVCNGKPPGSSPSHPIGWSKVQLGWIDSIEKISVGDFINISIIPTEFKSNDYSNIIKLPTNEGYYLIEAREQVGFDRGLPGKGIILTFVDIDTLPNKGGVRIIDAEESTVSLDDAYFSLDNNTYFEDIQNKVSIQIISYKNDVYTLIIDRREPLPELGIVSIEITLFDDIERNAEFSVEIANSGKRRANNFYVFSSIDGNRVYQEKLSLNSNSTFSFEIMKPMESGDHIFLVEIDPKNSVKEYREDNNERIEKMFLKYILEIKTDEVGMPIVVNDTTKLSDVNGSVKFYVERGIHSISVPKEFDLDLGERLIFEEWEGLSSDPTLVINVTKDIFTKSRYARQFYLDIDSKIGKVLGEGWYEENTYAKIDVETPTEVIEEKSRVVFTHWSGDLKTNSPNVTLFMNHSYRIVANWADQFFLNIESKYDNVKGEGWYESGSIANFSITETVIEGNNSKMLFKGWNGDHVDSGPFASVIMDKEKNIVAVWEEYFKITFGVKGLPDEVLVALILNETLYNFVIPSEINEWLKSGTVIVFQILPPDIVHEDNKYVFRYWENSKSETISSPILVDDSESFSALFILASSQDNIGINRLSALGNIFKIEPMEHIGGLIYPLSLLPLLIIILIFGLLVSIINVCIVSRKPIRNLQIFKNDPHKSNEI